MTHSEATWQIHIWYDSYVKSTPEWGDFALPPSPPLLHRPQRHREHGVYPRSRRSSDSKYLDLEIGQFSCPLFWVTGTLVYSREKKSVNFWGISWKLVRKLLGLSKNWIENLAFVINSSPISSACGDTWITCNSTYSRVLHVNKKCNTHFLFTCDTLVHESPRHSEESLVYRHSSEWRGLSCTKKTLFLFTSNTHVTLNFFSCYSTYSHVTWLVFK